MKNCLEQMRSQHPLILNLTNYVTVNSVANILLAAGASPVMSDEIQEMEDLVNIAQGVNLNLGTLNQRTIPAMFLAAQMANAQQKALVLDPVGAGASQLRTKTAQKLIQENQFTVIRGNISEIKVLAGGQGQTQGVDAGLSDLINTANLPEALSFVRKLAEQTGSIIAISGAWDLVGDSKQIYVLSNGRPEMSRITGTGCQLSGLIAALVAANPTQPLKAAATAVGLMGLAGEIAWTKLQPGEGNASYGQRIIDAICHLDGNTLEAGLQYEIY